MVDQALLTQELTRFAKMLVTEYPVSDALHDLVDATAAILEIHGAGVSLDRGDRLMFATASPRDIAALEEVQEREQAGPCIDAYRSGRPVLVADLAADKARWPALTAAAEHTGIVAVAAVSLHLNGTRLGALDLYDTKEHSWTAEEVQVAELLAALTTGYLANASRLDGVRQTAEQLREALDSRVVIEQAKGIVAGERGLSVDAAFGVIRAHARKNQAPIRDVAHAVVALGFRP